MAPRVIEPVAVDLSLDLEDPVTFELVEQYAERPDVGMAEVRELYEELGAEAVEIDDAGDGVTVRAEGEAGVRTAAALTTGLVMKAPGGEARLREALALLDLEDEIRGFE